MVNVYFSSGIFKVHIKTNKNITLGELQFCFKLVKVMSWEFSPISNIINLTPY